MQTARDIKTRKFETILASGHPLRVSNQLKQEGYSIITGREEAMLSLTEKPSPAEFAFSHYLNESVLHIPGLGVYITRGINFFDIYSENPESLNEHSGIIIGDDLVHKALKQATPLPIYRKYVNVSELASDPTALFLFQDLAREYGMKLKEIDKLEKLELAFDSKRVKSQRGKPKVFGLEITPNYFYHFVINAAYSKGIHKKFRAIKYCSKEGKK